MAIPKLISAARPPLPPGRKKATTTSLPGASSLLSTLDTRKMKGMKQGFPSVAPHLPSRNAGLSPSRTLLSPYAAVMPPQRNETSLISVPADITAAYTLMKLKSSVGPAQSRPVKSPSAAITPAQRKNLAPRQAEPSEIAAAHALLQLQGNVRSPHRVDIAKAENLGEGVVSHRAATSCRGNDTTAACATVFSNTDPCLSQVVGTLTAPSSEVTISRTSAGSQRLGATNIAATRTAPKNNRGSQPVSTSMVNWGFAIPNLGVDSHQVHAPNSAVISGIAKKCGKRRLDALFSDHLTERACTRVACFATKDGDLVVGSEKCKKRHRIDISASKFAFGSGDSGVITHKLRGKHVSATSVEVKRCGKKRVLDAPISEHLAKRVRSGVISSVTKEFDARASRGFGSGPVARKRERCYDICDKRHGKRSRITALGIGMRVHSVAVC